MKSCRLLRACGIYFVCDLIREVLGNYSVSGGIEDNLPWKTSRRHWSQSGGICPSGQEAASEWTKAEVIQLDSENASASPQESAKLMCKIVKKRNQGEFWGFQLMNMDRQWYHPTWEEHVCRQDWEYPKGHWRIQGNHCPRGSGSPVGCRLEIQLWGCWGTGMRY